MIGLLPSCLEVMDHNIAAAFWFAAQGKGVLWESSELSGVAYETCCAYTTTARALLMGAGADEQLGGYGRHRSAYEHGGMERLEEELNMDIQRIWSRNMGRDDRCVSDQGKEARYPFLDEEVREAIRTLPLGDIVDMKLGPGVGDKRVLREVARRLGLTNSSKLEKRAIQFGSRVAKACNQPKAKGDTKFTGIGEAPSAVVVKSRKKQNRRHKNEGTHPGLAHDRVVEQCLSSDNRPEGKTSKKMTQADPPLRDQELNTSLGEEEQHVIPDAQPEKKIQLVPCSISWMYMAPTLCAITLAALLVTSWGGLKSVLTKHRSR